MCTGSPGEPGRLVAEVEAFDHRRPRCGCCGQPVMRIKGTTRRRLWQDLKIRHLALVIAYTSRRVVCPDCGVRVEQVPWAERWSRVSKSLSRAVAELARRTDLTTVAQHYGINWKTVARVIHRAVQWGGGRSRCGSSASMRSAARKAIAI